jgi:hypothetical protein
VTEPLISRVGPKGYIHGWIFVGVPVAGDKVFHPHHGHGTIAEAGERHVRVRFDSGAHRSFPVHPDPAGARRLEHMSEEDLYRELMGRGEGEHYDRAIAELERRDSADHAAKVSALYAEHPKTAKDQDRVYQALVDNGENPEDAWAHAHGSSTEKLRKQAAIAQFRQQGYKGGSFDALSRDAFKHDVQRQVIDAENATNGYMLNPDGKQAGIDPWSLFTGTEARARRYSSPELREYWDQHGRPTFDDFKRMLLGQGGAKLPRGGDFYA